MAVTVSAVQNGDGTATLTVAGSGGGDTNTAYFLKVGSQYWYENAGEGSSDGWQLGDSRTGDGEIDITTGRGAVWFYVDSAGTPVAPVYQHVKTATDAVWDQILIAIQARIQLLMLDGIADAMVTTHAVIDQATVKRMETGDRIIIAPAGGEALQTTGPTSKDDLNYPVLVAHLHAANKQQSDESRSRWWLIRERIRKAFISQPLPVADGLVWRCTTAPLDPIVKQWWDDNAMVSPQQFVFTSREDRGL